MLKILQVRLQKYMNCELPDVQAEFRKGNGTRDQIANILWIIKKAKFPGKKNIYFCFIDYPKAFDCGHFSSVSQSCPSLCNSMCHIMPGLPFHHQFPEFTQTHVYWVGDAIQPSHPLSSPSPALKLSQHQGLFTRVSSSYQVVKVLEFQLQYQSFQWTSRTGLL